jgi:hypothetical protein
MLMYIGVGEYTLPPLPKSRLTPRRKKSTKQTVLAESIGVQLSTLIQDDQVIFAAGNINYGPFAVKGGVLSLHVITLLAEF